MKSILVLGKGDTQYSDRNRASFVDYAKKAGFEVLASDYHELGKLGSFKNEKINALFFFPYTFWNANCEVPEDTKLYGTSRAAYEKFSKYFLEVQGELEQKFRGHDIHYVIPPQNAPIDRDKVETISRLRANGVPTSEPVDYGSVDEIAGKATPKRGVFIKCRYGSEGKGITVLRHDKWVTNYKVEGNQLANYGVYDKWEFTEITGRMDLLGQLLQNAVIVEREILTPDNFGGMKFDLRAYVVGNVVPHLFIRLNNVQKEVTNYSQGATIKHHPETGIKEDCLRAAREIAKNAAKAMGLEFVGIDIMFDGSLENPKVVEAQAFTDFPDIRNFNMAKYMAGEGSGLFKA